MLTKNAVRVSSFALALACAAGADAGIRVLIVGDGSVAGWLTDVQAKVAGALPGPGNVVDIFNNDGGGTPTLGLLKTYDVVFAYTDGGIDDAVALGNVLADYVDAGGNVVERRSATSRRASASRAVGRPAATRRCRVRGRPPRAQRLERG